MIRQESNMPEKREDESWKDYTLRFRAWAEDVRTKVDLREFKTADFHLAPEK